MSSRYNIYNETELRVNLENREYYAIHKVFNSKLSRDTKTKLYIHIRMDMKRLVNDIS